MTIHACLIIIIMAAVTEAGKVGASLAKDFFREEYAVNHYIGKIREGSRAGGGCGGEGRVWLVGCETWVVRVVIKG